MNNNNRSVVWLSAGTLLAAFITKIANQEQWIVNFRGAEDLPCSIEQCSVEKSIDSPSQREKANLAKKLLCLKNNIKHRHFYLFHKLL